MSSRDPCSQYTSCSLSNVSIFYPSPWCSSFHCTRVSLWAKCLPSLCQERVCGREGGSHFPRPQCPGQGGSWGHRTAEPRNHQAIANLPVWVWSSMHASHSLHVASWARPLEQGATPGTLPSSRGRGTQRSGHRVAHEQPEGERVTAWLAALSCDTGSSFCGRDRWRSLQF